MHQARIDRYFLSRGASPIPRRSYFVDLPFNVRSQIYYEAGLVPNQYIDLNYWACPKTEDELKSAFNPYDHEEVLRLQADREEERLGRHSSISLSLPLRLFLVCRVTYLDVTSLVYSLNTFAISRHEPGGLVALENLSSLALKALRILIVNLNDCSFRHCRKSTLGSQSRADRMTLEQWKRICIRLSVHVPPRQLRMCLICDCSDLQTAREVAKIALALPILQDCATRLSILPDERLRQLAKATALRLMGRGEHTINPFRFLDLPKEIQLQILKYTNLIATSTLEWSPGSPPQFNPYPCIASTNNAVNLASTSFSTELLEWKNIPGLFLCSQKVSAFSSHCTCQGFPRSYFLVNHEFRNLAAEIFYSENHFILFCKDKGFSQTLVQASTNSLPLFTYLNSIPTWVIRHLTTLTLVFPPFEPSYLQPSQGGWKCWINGIEMLSRVTSVEKLKLEIYFTDIRWYEHEHTRPHYSDREYESDMVEAYKRITQPLAALRALRCLGVHVSWPIGRSRALERRKLENSLEMNTMGVEYDGRKAGKSPMGMFWWENLSRGDAYI